MCVPIQVLPGNAEVPDCVQGEHHGQPESTRTSSSHQRTVHKEVGDQKAGRHQTEHHDERDGVRVAEKQHVREVARHQREEQRAVVARPLPHGPRRNRDRRKQPGAEQPSDNERPGGVPLLPVDRHEQRAYGRTPVDR